MYGITYFACSFVNIIIIIYESLYIKSYVSMH